MFTKLFRILWVVFFFLLIFSNRKLLIVKVGLISFLIILSIITIIRALESKKEWKDILSEINNSELD